ncbi:hypothetical protein [Roseibium aggregatum]|uniref:Uncharacterized protein n=1 Tax=Roseibium aggregatum TaxID=187304 RepID=A0A926S611_9HYPH|nr:hypothetical protein [Roseibium aggregatum]MBD1545977.1 hypothetical protein [Roseibium aggregatum]
MAKTYQVVGKRFEALIGEPWDFEAEAGGNVLTGTITGAGDVDGRPTLFADCNGFLSGAETINTVAMRPRYKEDFGDKDRITVCFYFLKDGSRISPDNFPEWETGRLDGLIGSITLRENG